MIATLTEFMQGPCHGNQVEMTRGQFLETVNWILDAIIMAEMHKADAGYGSWQPLPFVTTAKHGESSDVSPAPDTRCCVVVSISCNHFERFACLFRTPA